ncbi:hypothetical protein V2J09_019253 [Rumex salicifolius]
MGKFSGFIIVIFLLGLAVAEAARAPIKPKHAAKCNDKKSPCYHLKPYCPTNCPTSCQVDCKTCQPVCTRSTPTPHHPPKSPPKKPSYPPPHPSPKRVRCMNKKYPLCYYKEYSCPAACPGSCQDPRFIGADGITFYFHGKKEHDFCLVADSNLHINAHFIGKRNQHMNRDFTWVQSLGILFDHHKLYIGAQKTATWNHAVDRLALSFDGEPILLPQLRGATWSSSNADLTITRSENANEVEMEAEGKFKIKAAVVPITQKESILHSYGIKDDEDSFAHLDLSFKFYSLSANVSGVLGQTYAPTYVSRVKMGVAMPVLGGDNLFSSSSLFSTDCAVSRFSGGGGDTEETYRFADLNCATGLTAGQGVVCKR